MEIHQPKTLDNVTLSRSEGSVALGDEMLPASVTLSRSEGSLPLGLEMLRSTQHDCAVLLPLFMA